MLFKLESCDFRDFAQTFSSGRRSERVYQQDVAQTGTLIVERPAPFRDPRLSCGLLLPARMHPYLPVHMREIAAIKDHGSLRSQR